MEQKNKQDINPYSNDGKEEYVNPSLGQIGKMYYDSNNNRIKYFSTEIHTSSENIEHLVEEGIRMMDDNGATRLNARFFYSDNKPYTQNIEAEIKLNNGYSDINLLFIGINESNRLDSVEILKLEDEIVNNVLSNKSSSRDRISDEYEIQKLSISNLGDGDVDSLVSLYTEAFTTYTSVLDTQSVQEMVDNSVVYAVRDKNTGKIVSTSVAEIGTVPMQTGDFRICELSEMATKKEHRGQGLVTYATKALINDIRDSVDLIYAEARASHRAINQSFHNLGFNYGGRLNKQCILSGDSDVAETGPYENLNVWYILPHDVEE